MRENKKTVVICIGAVIVLILLAVGVKKAVTAIVEKISSKSEFEEETDYDDFQPDSASKEMVLTYSEEYDVARLEAYAADHGEKVNYHSYATDSMGKSLYATLGPLKPDYMMFYDEEVDSY